MNKRHLISALLILLSLLTLLPTSVLAEGVAPEEQPKRVLVTDDPKVTAILRTILVITKDHQGETPEERWDRWEPIARVLAAEAKSIREISFTIAQGWHESRFIKHVQEGNCRKGTCDPGRGGVPNAHGPWQAWRAPDREDWQELWTQARTDGVAAVRLQLQMQRSWHCGGDLVKSFGAHGGGGCRETSKSKGREILRQRIERRLHRELDRAKKELRAVPAASN